MCFCCCVLTGVLEMTLCSSAELLLVYVAVSPREDVFLIYFFAFVSTSLQEVINSSALEYVKAQSEPRRLHITM